MNKRLSLIAACALLSIAAWAYPVSNYATSSLLSNGRWVKIAIPADGVYQLTSDELSQMGFSDINQVKIYGYGGHLQSEMFTGTEKDDLTEVATIVTGNKLCFYAYGPLEVAMQSTEANPYFTRKVNIYSNNGYYFITEGDSPLRVENFGWSTGEQATQHSTSYNYFLHENDLATISQTGKDIVGESLLDDSFTLNYNLANVASPDVMVQTSLAVCTKNGTSTMSVKLKSGGQTVNIDYSSVIIQATSPTLKFVNYAPKAMVKMPSLQATGQITVNKIIPATSTVSVQRSNLDYVMITYLQNNTLSGLDTHQQMMYLPLVNQGDTIVVSDASSSTVVWNINGPQPISLKRTNASGKTLFSSPLVTRNAQFVTFDPAQPLRSIGGYELIANQDIHGQPTPDYIIVTHRDFLPAAERLADFHHSNDGLNTLVVTQDDVFNEFSSGTPDAMAIRKMCKMFYDRNPETLKYLLLMGQGSYDNRRKFTNKSGVLITFETDESASESTSHCSDDFFGILGDGTGRSINNETICLGVGRLTPENLDEAYDAVEKIVNYVTNVDYGAWRNNMLFMADQGDTEMHTTQAQEILDIAKKEKNVVMNQSKAFIPFFPTAVDEDMLTSDKRSSPEATRYVAAALSSGQYFSTYIGHASSSVFTASSKLWSINNVNTVSYPHLPIMTAACCEAARFDASSRSIAERMAIKKDGGAIAVMSTTRATLGNQNHITNLAFVRTMFTPNNNGTMPMLGDIVRMSKNNVNNLGGARNKMFFVLLGDPAIRVNYPLPRFKVTKVNGIDVSDGQAATTSPMQRVQVEAQVMNAAGTAVDNSFNGKAYVTLFDSERLYMNTKGRGTIPYDITFPRTQLAQVDATVTNGLLKTSILVPRDLQAQGDLRISVYAHKTGSELMVNGEYCNLAVEAYDASTAVTDNQAPVIKAMYFDDKDEFAEQPAAVAGSMLHIEVTDETALSMTQSLSGKMRLVLDGGAQSYYLVDNFATISNGGKQMDVTMPVNDIDVGRHTLAFTVMDVAGNSTTKTIDFIVEQPTNVIIKADERVATNEATFVVEKNTLPELPELTIRVTDVTGNIVWQKTATSMPCKWDLKGLNGTRVPNGVYRYWATYDDENYYGGTPKADLVVVAP